MYAHNVSSFSDTQLKCSHHEGCLGAILWMPPDEESVKQHNQSEDRYKHQTPYFQIGQSVQCLAQNDTKCYQTCNWRKNMKKSDQFVEQRNKDFSKALTLG